MFHYIVYMESSALVSLVFVRGVDAARDPWAEDATMAVLVVSGSRTEYFLGREHS